MEEDNRSIEQENLLRSLRFIEEICFLLRLSRPCAKTAMDYFHLLNSSDTHQFQIQIMIAASIFLSAKVFETELKIRDILNMVFVDTALHRIIKQEEMKAEEEGRRFSISETFKKEGLKEAIQPTYSFNNYNQFKPKILEAQQHLLRILGFDFTQSQKNLTEYKTILVLIHQLRLPQIMAQAVLNTYNDLPFTGSQKWIAGIFYFGYLVGRSASKGGLREELSISNEEWQAFFCTKIEKLRNYANKIASFYEKRHYQRQSLNSVEMKLKGEEKKQKSDSS